MSYALHQCQFTFASVDKEPVFHEASIDSFGVSLGLGMQIGSYQQIAQVRVDMNALLPEVKYRIDQYLCEDSWCDRQAKGERSELEVLLPHAEPEESAVLLVNWHV